MELNFYTYSIPFKQPFVTAGQSFGNRSGIIAVFKRDGIQALGEAAPLPGFSRETICDVARQIRSEKNSIIQFFNNPFTLETLEDFFAAEQFTHSLRFCLYSITACYEAQKKNTSLHQAIFNDQSLRAVPLNAVVGIDKEMREKVAGYIEQGFNTIKIKASPDAQSLVKELKKIRAEFPDVRLRVDANQSWNLKKALIFLKQSKALALEYCEEPLKTPDKAAIAQLKNETTVPIALDESLVDTFTLREAASLADVLIIKPMVHGPAVNILGEIRKKHAIKIVLTSSLETGIGRLMTATLAAGIGAQATAHGVATGSLLAEDLWRDDQFINNGMFELPNANELSDLMTQDITGINMQKIA